MPCRDDLAFRMLTARRRPRQLREFKTCEECGQDYERSASINTKQWRGQRWCSYRCMYVWRRKHWPLAWSRTSDDVGLEELIRQQAQEMAWGNRQYPSAQRDLPFDVLASELSDERRAA